MGKRCSLWCRRSGDQQPSDTRPDLHDAWQDYPRDGRQSFHSVRRVMPESKSLGKRLDLSAYLQAAASSLAIFSEQT